MENEKTQQKRNWRKELLEWLVALLVALVVAIVLTQVVFVNARVPSESMENTIQIGDRVLGYRLSYLFSEPERLDIIIFRFPDNPSELYVKRIIGLPGDTVELREGRIYINGATEPLADEYVKGIPNGRGDGIYQVPAGHYFVMGDNRNESSDSRFWFNTYVPAENIVGRAGLRLWPSPGKLE